MLDVYSSLGSAQDSKCASSAILAKDFLTSSPPAYLGQTSTTPEKKFPTALVVGGLIVGGVILYYATQVGGVLAANPRPAGPEARERMLKRLREEREKRHIELIRRLEIRVAEEGPDSIYAEMLEEARARGALAANPRAARKKEPWGWWTSPRPYDNPKLQWQGSGSGSWARGANYKRYKLLQRAPGEWLVLLDDAVIGAERTPALAKRIAQEHEMRRRGA